MKLTEEELAVLWFNLKSLLETDLLMKRTISGSSELAEKMSRNDFVLQQVFEKLDKNKERYVKIIK